MNSDNFDDIIKRKADSHQASVPADAWDNINKKKKKKPVVIFWWSLSSLLIVGILFIYIHSNKKSNDIFVLNHTNTTNNSLSQLNKTTNNNNTTNTILNNNVNTSQQNNNTNKQVAENVTNKTLSTSNNKIGQTLQTKEYSITTGNSSPVISYASTKKLKYSQHAKFKSTTINAAIDSDAIDKPTNNSNNIDVADNATQQKKRNKINPQKNDLSKVNNDTTTTIQKPKTPDSTTKVKETDIGETNKKDQNKKNITTNKKTTNHSLVLDFSTTPFSPIQSYSQPTYIQRSGNHSIYTANSIQTSLQSSVAFSLDIKKGISKKLMIGTGIQYARISENIKLAGQETDTTFTNVQRLEINGAARFLGNDTIVTTTTGTRNINAVNSYQLFSIPLFINYTFVNRPIFSLSFTAGVYFTFAQYQNSIDGKLQSVYPNGIQADNEKNKLVTDIFSGLRLSWYVSKKYQLFTEPNFRYNLNNYELKNSFINKTINQAGVSVGVSYKIK